MPADVYTRMQHCFWLIHQLAEANQLPTLHFEVLQEGVERVRPNDVADLAALIVEELAQIHRRIPEVRAPVRAYYPGKRFPAHVYQRVGLLERVLEDLVEAAGASARSSPGAPTTASQAG